MIITSILTTQPIQQVNSQYGWERQGWTNVVFIDDENFDTIYF